MSDRPPSSGSEASEAQKKPIMLSYSWKYQELVIQIKEGLEKFGYENMIWFDTEQMSGSTLDCMAGAVDNSEIVLMCFSKEYKKSKNCKFEGEYTFMKKPFIPLIVESGYARKADGWLGGLLGAKLYFDFTRAEKFEDNLANLVKEIGQIVPALKRNPRPSSATSEAGSATPNQHSSVTPAQTPSTSQDPGTSGAGSATPNQNSPVPPAETPSTSHDPGPLQNNIIPLDEETQVAPPRNESQHARVVRQDSELSDLLVGGNFPDAANGSQIRVKESRKNSTRARRRKKATDVGDYDDMTIDSFSARRNRRAIDVENSEGLTELTESIFMYNNEPLRPETKVFVGFQIHANGQERQLAIKAIIPSNDKSYNEVQCLVTLGSHPNVVQIIDSIEHKVNVRELYIAMELCSSQNLQDYVKENQEKNVPLDFGKTMSYSKQLVAGISHIHDHGIIHRDMKPENVLFSICRKFVKLSDFGISKELRYGRSKIKPTFPGQGTDGYRSPETYNSNEITKKSDIYSLGLTVRVLWTNGKHPFGPDPDLWNSNIKKNQNRLPPKTGLPPDMHGKEDDYVNLVDEMLQHCPEHRPTAGQISQHVFFSDEHTTLKGVRDEADLGDTRRSLVISQEEIATGLITTAQQPKALGSRLISDPEPANDPLAQPMPSGNSGNSENESANTAPDEDNTVNATGEDGTVNVAAPGENESAHTAPDEDNTVNALSEDDLANAAAPGKNDTLNVAAPGEDDTVNVAAPGENESANTAPGEDDTVNVAAPGENDTLNVAAPGEDDTVNVAAPGENESANTAPGENDTVNVAAPGENESANTAPDDDDTVNVAAPGEDNTVNVNVDLPHRSDQRGVISSEGIQLENFLFYNKTSIYSYTCVTVEATKEHLFHSLEEAGYGSFLHIPFHCMLAPHQVMSYELRCISPRGWKLLPEGEVCISGEPFCRGKTCEPVIYSIQPVPGENPDKVLIEYTLNRPNEALRKSVLTLEWRALEQTQHRSLLPTTSPGAGLSFRINESNNEPNFGAQPQGMAMNAGPVHGSSQDMTTTVHSFLANQSTEDAYQSHLRSNFIYRIDPQRPKGKVLIINNNIRRSRKGSDVDVENMKRLWTALGFAVEVSLNITARQMFLSCKRFAMGAKDISVVVVIIMSHGGRSEDGGEFVMGEDRDRLQVCDIIALFSTSGAPHLKGIPKLFLLQSCRGDALESIVSADAAQTPVFHDRADMLIAYPTQSGYMAFRHAFEGSWLVNAITNVFIKHAHDTHVMDMLTMVNDVVAKRITHDGWVQTSNQENYLRKQLYLFPGWPN